VLGREIVVGVAEERFRGGDQFRVGFALAQGGTTRRCGHGVHVRIIEKPWVRMVIENRNLLDLREKTFINLPNVGAGKWTGLAEGNSTEYQKTANRPD
jgi:hypothetical protein